MKAALATDNGKQALLASLATALSAAIWIVLPEPYSPIALPVTIFAVIYAIRQPSKTCLAFILFSLFRFHEVFPVLLPLRLPLVLATLTGIALMWHLFLTTRLTIFWSGELKSLMGLFVVATAGIIFAANPQLALSAWSENYWKIAVTTVAIAWLMQDPTEFEFAARAIVLAGIMVSAVAITNSWTGIGLVEQTRVTIGRDIGSAFGDPNELALTLITPLSFAVAFILHRSGLLNTLIGLVGAGASLYCITLTQSRGALVGLLAVLLVTGSRLVRSKTLLVAVVLGGGLAMYAAMGIAERQSGGQHDVKEEAAMSRVYAWVAATRMAIAQPLTGAGLGNFEEQMVSYNLVYTEGGYAAHSVWFDALGQTGFLGFIFFTAMILASAKSIRWTLGRLRALEAPPGLQATALGLAASIAGFCGAGSFLSMSFRWPIYLLIGLTAAVTYYARTGNNNARRTASGEIK